MSEVEQLERQVQLLSTGDLSQFREWFLEFDAAIWDQKIERDSAGNSPLEALAKAALAEHAAGQTRAI